MGSPKAPHLAWRASLSTIARPELALQDSSYETRRIKMPTSSCILALEKMRGWLRVTSRLLDPDDVMRRLESRLGPLHARLRLGIEREHQEQAFGQGLNFLHLENMPLMQAIIEIALRVTGTYWRGRANAGKVQLRRNTVHLANLPSAFDGFTILHLSDLHADLSGPAMERVADLAHDLAYDLCVLTGDYRGRTHGDFEPCLEIVAHLRETL